MTVTAEETRNNDHHLSIGGRYSGPTAEVTVAYPADEISG